MKQRRSPTMLIVVLALALGAVVFISMAFPKMTGQAGPEAPPPEAQIGKSRSVPSKEEVAEKVNEVGGAPTPKRIGGGPAEPSILMRQPVSDKPVPSDSSTSRLTSDTQGK